MTVPGVDPAAKIVEVYAVSKAWIVVVVETVEASIPIKTTLPFVKVNGDSP